MSTSESADSFVTFYAFSKKMIHQCPCQWCWSVLPWSVCGDGHASFLWHVGRWAVFCWSCLSTRNERDRFVSSLKAGQLSTTRAIFRPRFDILLSSFLTHSQPYLHLDLVILSCGHVNLILIQKYDTVHNISRESLFLSLLRKSPAELKISSDGTDNAGTPRTLLATTATIRNRCLFSRHHSN